MPRSPNPLRSRNRAFRPNDLSVRERHHPDTVSQGHDQEQPSTTNALEVWLLDREFRQYRRRIPHLDAYITTRATESELVSKGIDMTHVAAQLTRHECPGIGYAVEPPQPFLSNRMQPPASSNQAQ